MIPSEEDLPQPDRDGEFSVPLAPPSQERRPEIPRDVGPVRRTQETR
jgi:hypothetical protein